MSESIADLMHNWYSTQLGHDGDLIELEREYFGATAEMTWADAALIFYAGANGSNPVGSLRDEAYKYYSGLSGLEPPEEYSFADHLYYTFSSGAGHSPIPLANLVAWFESDALLGFSVEPNLFPEFIQLCDATNLAFTNRGVGSSAPAVDATTAVYSTSSLVVTSGAGPGFGINAGRATAPITTVDVTPGKSYTGHVFAKHTLPSQPNVAFCISWMNGDAYLPETTQTIAITDQWKKFTVTGVAPANATRAFIYVMDQNNTTPGNKLWIDQCGFWEGISTFWRDSNGLPADGTPVDVWNDISAAGENLLTLNQSTGGEVDTAGFYARGGAPNVNRSPAQKMSGSWSITATATASADMGWGTMTASNPAGGVPVVAGRTYTCSVWLYCATSKNAQLYMTFLNASNTQTAVSGPIVTLDAGVWKQFHVTAVAPDGAIWGGIAPQLNGATPGLVVYSDQWSFVTGWSTIWAPANPLKNPYDLTQTVPENRPLFRNANPNMLDYDTATFEGGVSGLNGYLVSVIRVIDQAQQGKASAEVTYTGNGGVCYTLGSPLPSVDRNKTYTAVGYFRPKTTTATRARASIWWCNSAGTGLTFANGDYVDTPAGAWTKLTVTVNASTAPADAVYMRVCINPETAISGESYYVDSLSLREGPITDWLPPVSLPNSEPVVQHSGVVRLTNASLPMTNPITMYVVSRITAENATAQNYPAVAWEGAGTPGYYINPSGKFRYYYGGAAAVNAFGAAANNWAVFSATVQNSPELTTAYRNGYPGTPGAAGTASPSGVFATAGSASHSTHHDIVAILLYNVFHSDSQRKTIEDYLINKYGISVFDSSTIPSN